LELDDLSLHTSEGTMSNKKKRKKTQRPTGVCALCQQTRELHYSHIISEFLYQKLYDAKHKFPLIEADPRKRRGPPLQKGIREYLLCGSCEQRFCAWETDASKVFRNVFAALEGKRTAGIQWANAEYQPFRLFLLSLLWRLNATSDRLGGNIALGSHAEHIRQHLLDGTVPEPDRYPCLLVALLFREDGIFHPEMTLPPSAAQREGFQVIRVVISGLLFMYFVPAEIPSVLEPLYLKRDNALYIVVLPEEMIPHAFETRGSLGAGELLRQIERIRKDLVQKGQADPNAPVTVEFLKTDQ
jgi:hypothetical protein